MISSAKLGQIETVSVSDDEGNPQSAWLSELGSWTGVDDTYRAAVCLGTLGECLSADQSNHLPSCKAV